jgi:glycosyltransferase involved in cell wall biosynthesis
MSTTLLYLITGGNLSETNGLDKFVLDLASFLYSKHVGVKVIYRHGELWIPGSQLIDYENDVSSGSFGYLLSHLPNPITIVLSSANMLRQIRIDKGRKRIIHVHDISSSFFIGFFLSKIYNFPLIVQIHGFPLREQYLKVGCQRSFFFKTIWFFSKLFQIISIKLLKFCSAKILVNNTEIRNFYVSNGISNERLQVISATVNLRDYEDLMLPASKVKVSLGLNSTNDLVIGYIGGLRVEKNLSFLINAFSRLVRACPTIGATLVIIGDGPNRFSLERLVDSLQMEKRVIFAGKVYRAFRYLSAIDIFVLPSLSEGSPTSLLEAMASKRCIIASDIPAIREIVSNYKEAILVSPNNIEEMTEKLLCLCKSPNLRNRLANNAFKRVTIYDKEQVFSNILSIYNRMSF